MISMLLRERRMCKEDIIQIIIRNKVKSKEIAGYIESLKKASAKNNPIGHTKSSKRDLSQQRPSLRNKRDLLSRKSRQKVARRADKIITNTRRVNNPNQAKFLEMSSTPEYSNNRYNGTKNLNNSNSFIRGKNYHDQTKLMDSSMRMMRMRQSESTKPVRNMRITGRTPSKMRNSKIRASSNPRLGKRDMHSNSSANFKGRKGQLMSSSKLGKIISEQTNNLLEQKERIQQIYDPGNVILKSTASNIKVADEFPSIKNKNLNSASKVIINPDNRGKKMREIMYNSGEWSNKQKKDTEILGKIPQGLMSTEVGRRENLAAEDFSRAKNEATSHSLLGNMHPNEHRLKKQLLKDNSTVPIKYDTTAVISEEYSNFEDPFTQMYTNSILSGGRMEKNIEEMHYLQINLCKLTRRMLEKTEKDNKEHKSEKKPGTKDPDNLLEICSETSIE
ncbi:unnamed protein product [Moneuplotes crassus]|uniref:Uncharacterized protein n=1 Tax=Euplotes crassus TaxID=5936 RepID=A0AAD1UE81_EUPCR|nr:unnamed protein product [Moneuplotes crassus]